MSEPISTEPFLSDYLKVLDKNLSAELNHVDVVLRIGHVEVTGTLSTGQKLNYRAQWNEECSSSLERCIEQVFLDQAHRLRKELLSFFCELADETRH